MTRPSRNQDQLLIETAKRLLPETGVSGMSLKRIAEDCGVNLGMFHYHFKTKSAFIRKVLESFNQEFQFELETGALSGDTSIKRLRSAILAITRRMLREKKIVVSMVRDFLNGDKDVVDFVVRVHKQRLAVIGPLIEECRKDGYLEPLPLGQIISFFMCSVSFPVLISEAIERAPSKKLKLGKEMKESIVSDAALQQRIDLALKAICRKGVLSK
jgi:AcrR family transcriptional regulator